MVLPRGFPHPVDAHIQYTHGSESLAGTACSENPSPQGHYRKAFVSSAVDGPTWSPGSMRTDFWKRRRIDEGEAKVGHSLVLIPSS